MVKAATVASKIGEEVGLLTTSLAGPVFVAITMALVIGAISLLLPASVRNKVMYSTYYSLPYNRVDFVSEPTDCDFMRAPLGDKECDYKKAAFVERNERGRVTFVSVTWLKVLR